MPPTLLHGLLIRAALLNGTLFVGGGILMLCYASMVSRGIVFGLALVMFIDGYHSVVNGLQVAQLWNRAGQLMNGFLLIGGGTLLLLDAAINQKNLTIIMLAMSVIAGAYRLTAAFVVNREVSKDEVLSGASLVLVGVIGWLTFPISGNFVLGLLIGFFFVKEGVSILQFVPLLVQQSKTLEQSQPP